MAFSSTTSLTLLAPPSLHRNWIHHVFPSFHGPDVRKNFLSHVLKELRSKGIDVFIDNDIERSKSISPELIEAIKGSRIALVLLSKNYASSTWCLNELVEIINCREVLGQTVITLFYEADPTDIKKQTGAFGKVFEETCNGKTEGDIQRWKHALTEVAQIAGFHSSSIEWETEAKMIEAIATEVSNKLNLSAPCSDFDGLVGMESQMSEIRRLLPLDSDVSVRKIGFWGPSGIGKTTLARYIFNQYSRDFQMSVFMDNIKRKHASPACFDKHSVKLDLQEKLMSQVTNDKDIKVPHLGVAKDRLKGKKVLFVLDDVDQSVQVEAMANETCVGPGSLIIITTQDQKVLKASGINHIHEVDLPSYDEARQIFCINAFGQKFPKDGFKELAWEVTDLVDRLPLGLEVMGSYFRGMSEQEWTEALPNLRAHLDRDGEIASVLKFSYDALNDEDKRLFLYIACFFHFEGVGIVEACLAQSFLDLTQGLHVLTQKSLITDDGRIHMPNMLIQLGKKIVQQEYPSEPGKRQFLSDARDIAKVLSDDKAGNSNVIGINFDHYNEEITSSTSEKAFERLSNLQFLRIGGTSVNPRSMNYISQKLRVLIWHEFQMPCFPSSFNPELLVELIMTESTLEKLWEEIKPLSNLKMMDLSFSGSLKELPDLSTATDLYILCVSCCPSLVKLPSSIGNAFNLRRLILSFCSSLVELPSSIGNAINLRLLDLSFCSNLVKLPYSIGNATNLQELDISYCSSLVELPSSMRNLGRLSKLKLKGCSKLEVNLANINLESLEKLDLSGCSLLKSYPESSTDTQDLDSWIGRISRLCRFVLGGMKKLVSLLPLPDSLGEHLTDCFLLESYAESSTDIQELDPWIGRISFLRRLKLNKMKKLVSLPPLPDSVVEIYAENCESLEMLDSCFHNPDIIFLNFANCFKLNQEARDVIIHTPTNEYAVFPAEEVPMCFTDRSSGSSLTVKLNQLPVGRLARFKACILCAGDDKNEAFEGEVDETEDLSSDEEEEESRIYSGSICCSITSGGNSLTYCKKEVETFFLGHLYIFEVEVETEEVSSIELVFDFGLLNSDSRTWKIKECGILQLPEVPFEDYKPSDIELVREDDGDKRLLLCDSVSFLIFQ